MDSRDLTILYHLCRNYRTGFKELAKVTNLSKDSVKYRFERMKKLGIIKNQLLLIDPLELGMEMFQVFIRIKNPDPVKEKKLEKFLESKPGVLQLFRLTGSWDYFVLVSSKDSVAIGGFFMELREKFRDLVGETFFLLESKEYKIRAFPDFFFFEAKKTPLRPKRDLSFSKELEKYSRLEFKHGGRLSLNEEEIRLLTALNQDLRASVSELAVNMGFSKEKTKAMILSVIKKKAINAFWPELDFKPLGLMSHFALIKFSFIGKEKEKELARLIKPMPFIDRAVRTIGDFDLALYYKTRTVEEFFDSQRKFRKMLSPLIEKYVYFEVVKQVKWQTDPKMLK